MSKTLLGSVVAILDPIPNEMFQHTLKINAFEDKGGNISGLLIRTGSNGDRGVLMDSLIRSGFSSPKDWSVKEINQNIPWESYPDLFVFPGSFSVVQGRAKNEPSDIPAPQDSEAIEIQERP